MAKVQLTRPERKQGSTDDYVKQRRGVITGPPSPPPKGRGGVPVGPLFPALSKKEEKEKHSTDALASVLDQVNQLTPEQQKELLANLALKSQTAPSKHDRELEMWLVAVYGGLEEAIGGGGRGLSGPANVKRLLASSSSWGSVKNFMQTSNLASLSVTERQSIYVLLAKLVIDNARWISRKAGMPMSAKLVANCAVNVAGIFEQAFPGYLESGLALLVARQLISNKNLA